MFLGGFRHVSTTGYKVLVEWKGDDESLFAVVKKWLLHGQRVRKTMVKLQVFPIGKSQLEESLNPVF